MLVQLLVPQARLTPGLTAQTVEFAAHTGFYRAVEVGEVLDRGERAELHRLRIEHDLRLVYWVSLLQIESTNSICAVAEPERSRAVAELSPHLHFAAECGADVFAFVPGRDPGADQRPRALESLKRSILELAEAGASAGVHRFAVETMDREAHKKHVLGPTTEALALFDELRAQVPDLSLAFDSSHVRLLGEDPALSLRAAAGRIATVHLANCVPDPNAPEFGDHHMPFGPPGFLDHEEMGRLLQALADVSTGPDAGADATPIVSLEVAGSGGDGANDVEREQRRFVREVLSELGWSD